MLSEIDYGEDAITIHISNELNFQLTLKQQIDNLREDILQVRYKNGKILDVGWYPEAQINGCFNIAVISSENWEEPIQCLKCATLDALRDGIVRMVAYIQGDLQIV